MQDILVENGKCTGLKAVSAEANRARLEAMEAEEAVKTQEEIQPGGEIPGRDLCTGYDPGQRRDRRKI